MGSRATKISCYSPSTTHRQMSVLQQPVIPHKQYQTALLTHLRSLFCAPAFDSLSSSHVPTDLLLLIADMAAGPIDCNPELFPSFAGGSKQLYRLTLINNDFHRKEGTVSDWILWIAADSFSQLYAWLARPAANDLGPVRVTLAAQRQFIQHMSRRDNFNFDSNYFPKHLLAYREMTRSFPTWKGHDVQIEMHKRFEIMDASRTETKEKDSIQTNRLWLLTSSRRQRLGQVDEHRFYLFLRSPSELSCWRWILEQACKGHSKLAFLDPSAVMHSFGCRTTDEFLKRPPSDAELSRWLELLSDSVDPAMPQLTEWLPRRVDMRTAESFVR